MPHYLPQPVIGVLHGVRALHRPFPIALELADHLGNGAHVAVDLLGNGALLLRRSGDMADEIVDLHHFPRHQIQRRIHLAGVFCRILTTLTGVAHGHHHCLGAPLQPGQHGLNLGGTLLGAARQGAHLIGHHGESASLLTGPGSLDGGVEGQQVGLLGDAADDPEYGANLLHILLHGLDGVGRGLHLGHQGGHAGHGLIHDLA